MTDNFIICESTQFIMRRCSKRSEQKVSSISLLLEILVIILLPISSIGPYYRWFTLSAHLVILNTIACSVFRNVRLGKYRQDTISCRSTSGNFISTTTSLDPEQAFSTVEFHTDSATAQDSLVLTNMEGENKSKDLH
jgi:hypothetical protein